MFAFGGEWGTGLKIQNAKSKTMKFLILNLEFPTLPWGKTPDFSYPARVAPTLFPRLLL